MFTVSASLNICMLWIELSNDAIKLTTKKNVEKSKKLLVSCSLIYLIISVALSLITASYNDTAILSVFSMAIVSCCFIKGSFLLSKKLDARMMISTYIVSQNPRPSLTNGNVRTPILTIQQAPFLCRQRNSSVSSTQNGEINTAIPEAQNGQRERVPSLTNGNVRTSILTIHQAPFLSRQRNSSVSATQNGERNTAQNGQRERVPRRERDLKVKKIINCARKIAINAFVFCCSSVLYTICSPSEKLGTIAFVFSIMVTLNGLFVLSTIQSYLEGGEWTHNGKIELIKKLVWAKKRCNF